MGITAKLEDERGEPLETVEDPRNVLHRILPQKGGLLAYIDWYGDTVYNHLQAKQFLAEWDELQPKLQDEEDKRVFGGIRGLAARLQGENHLYLKFYVIDDASRWGVRRSARYERTRRTRRPALT